MRVNIQFYGSTDDNKELLEKYTEIWDEIKNEIETVNGGKKGEYGNHFMNIKFDTDDVLPLNKPQLLDLFLKKTVYLIHKFIQTSVCMSYKQ